MVAQLQSNRLDVTANRRLLIFMVVLLVEKIVIEKACLILNSKLKAVKSQARRSMKDVEQRICAGTEADERAD
jgi:hypothetical protein